MIADKATNKLIVMSSGRDYFALKNIIAELDEPRTQVYIEATILEVKLQNDLDFGVSEHGTVSPPERLGAGRRRLRPPALSSTSATSIAGPSGLLGGVLGPALASSSLLGTSFPSYGLVFQALGTNSNARILSAPSIIALDNEQTRSTRSAPTSRTARARSRARRSTPA